MRMLHDSLRRDGCPISKCVCMCAKFVSKTSCTLLPHHCICNYRAGKYCLERLNRTRLLDDDSLDSIERRLGDGDVTSTLFAPVLMDTEADNETIASHLATGSFRAERLYSCQRLTTVASGHFIHVTSVRVSKHNIINYCVVATDIIMCISFFRLGDPQPDDCLLMVW